jgi:G3E family GTPase
MFCQSNHADICSGSAFPATLALRIRELEPKGFKLDGVVTVIDCVNFRGYEDTSPSAKVSSFTFTIRTAISADPERMLKFSSKLNTPTFSF